MKFDKTVIAILAIFIVIMGVAAVSADDNIGDNNNPNIGDDDDPDLNDNQDDNLGDDENDDEENEGDDEENSDEEETEEDVSPSPDENETSQEGPEVISPAKGNTESTTDYSVNATLSTDNASAAQNNTPTASAGGDAINTVADHATGNPIFVLLVILAVLGIYPLKR